MTSSKSAASEAHQRQLFATPVLETRVPNADAINARLLPLIRDRQKNTKGMIRSNVNGWHSDEELLNWGGDAAHAIAVAVIETCSRFTTDTQMKDNQPRFAWTVQMWANVSPAGASNQYHAHPGAVWSAVYYVDDGGAPATGPLILLDPRFPMNRMAQPDLRIHDGNGNIEQSQIQVLPTPGTLVAFPSWLSHGVKPHTGARDRVSIAINLLAVPVQSKA